MKRSLLLSFYFMIKIFIFRKEIVSIFLIILERNKILNIIIEENKFYQIDTNLKILETII